MHVAHALGEIGGAPRVGGVVAHQVAVFLQMRAAAGRIDQDRVGRRCAVGQEGVDVLARELARQLNVATVRVQRSAADLFVGRGNGDAVAREHAHGRAVRLRVGQRHHAAGQQVGVEPDGLCGSFARGLGVVVEPVTRVGRERLDIGECGRQTSQQAAAAHERLQAAELEQLQPVARQAHPPRRGEDPAHHDVPDDPSPAAASAFAQRPPRGSPPSAGRRAPSRGRPSRMRGTAGTGRSAAGPAASSRRGPCRARASARSDRAASLSRSRGRGTSGTR